MHMVFLSRGFKNLQWYSMTSRVSIAESEHPVMNTLLFYVVSVCTALATTGL